MRETIEKLDCFIGRWEEIRKKTEVMARELEIKTKKMAVLIWAMKSLVNKLEDEQEEKCVLSENK